MSRRAVVIPFPVARVRRPRRRVTEVFTPLHEVAALERAEQRFLWLCTAATMIACVIVQFGVR